MPTRKLTLYHAVPSRAAIARWMLEEIGHPYEVKLLDLQKSEQFSPEYLAINPVGKVPAIKHGDVVVTEVAAICCYLADAFPEANLAPVITDPLRGPYLKWLFYGPSCIEPAVIAKTMGWTGGRRGMLGWADFDTVVEVVCKAVEKGPYILGEQFTAADVVIGARRSAGDCCSRRCPSGRNWSLMRRGSSSGPHCRAKSRSMQRSRRLRLHRGGRLNLQVASASALQFSVAFYGGLPFAEPAFRTRTVPPCFPMMFSEPASMRRSRLCAIGRRP